METADIDCGEFADRLDDYVDDALAAADAAALERHAAGCTACRQRVERETRLRELLQDYGESVVPLPDAAWFERALAQAAADGARQQKNRWLMTAVGGAIAAGVALLVVAGMLLRTPAPLPSAAGDDDQPEVTMDVLHDLEHDAVNDEFDDDQLEEGDLEDGEEGDGATFDEEQHEDNPANGDPDT